MRVLRGKCNQAAGGRGAPVPSPSERGVALLVVLGFMVLFAVMAMVFSANMGVEAKLARNSEAGPEVEWVCRSGVEFAKYILSQQMANTQEPYDSLNQSWAGGPGNTNGVNVFFESLDLTDSGWGEGTVLGLLYPDQDPGEIIVVPLRSLIWNVSLISTVLPNWAWVVIHLSRHLK